MDPIHTPSKPIPTAQRLDFSTTALAAHYSSCFALIIDNVYTPAECAAIAASVTPENGWAPIEFHGHGTRNHERLFLDDAVTAAELWARVLPFVPATVTSVGPTGAWASIVAGVAQTSWARGEVGVWRAKEFVRRSPTAL